MDEKKKTKKQKKKNNKSEDHRQTGGNEGKQESTCESEKKPDCLMFIFKSIFHLRTKSLSYWELANEL